MALENTDFLALYRETTKENLKVSIGSLYSNAPAPNPPSLNAVLQQGNTSSNIDIVINNEGGGKTITLDASQSSITAAGNIFTNGNYKSQGPDASLTLTNTDVSSSSVLSMSDSSVTTLNNVEGSSMEFQFAGTKQASLSSTGLFEAGSIDGGVYATNPAPGE